MTKHEFRMTKQMQIFNNEGPKQQRGKISAFGLRHSFGIRHWSFVISRLLLVLILVLEISCVGRRITKANVDEVAEGMSKKQVESDRKSTRLNSSHLGISYAVF